MDPGASPAQIAVSVVHRYLELIGELSSTQLSLPFPEEEES
jgi:hypothetical protein